MGFYAPTKQQGREPPKFLEMEVHLSPEQDRKWLCNETRKETVKIPEDLQFFRDFVENSRSRRFRNTHNLCLTTPSKREHTRSSTDGVWNRFSSKNTPLSINIHEVLGGGGTESMKHVCFPFRIFKLVPLEMKHIVGWSLLIFTYCQSVEVKVEKNTLSLWNLKYRQCENEWICFRWAGVYIVRTLPKISIEFYGGEGFIILGHAASFVQYSI